MGWDDWKFRFGCQWKCWAGGYYHEHNTEEEVRECKGHHHDVSSLHTRTINELTAAKNKNKEYQKEISATEDKLRAAQNQNIKHQQEISATKEELTKAYTNLEMEKNAGILLKMQLMEKEEELIKTRTKAEKDLQEAKTGATLELEHVKGRYLQEFAKLLITDEPNMDDALQWVKEETASDPGRHTMVCVLEQYRENKKQRRTNTTSNIHFFQQDTGSVWA